MRIEDQFGNGIGVNRTPEVRSHENPKKETQHHHRSGRKIAGHDGLALKPNMLPKDASMLLGSELMKGSEAHLKPLRQALQNCVQNTMTIADRAVFSRAEKHLRPSETEVPQLPTGYEEKVSAFIRRAAARSLLTPGAQIGYG